MRENKHAQILIRCFFIVAFSLLGAIWLKVTGPYHVVRIMTPLAEYVPFWYMLTAFPILGMLVADLFDMYKTRQPRPVAFELVLQIAVMMMISNARLGLLFPISGHSLIVCYFITRRLLNDQQRGFYRFELAFAIATLIALTYTKLVWWTDPVTLFIGAAVGCALAFSSKYIVNRLAAE